VIFRLNPPGPRHPAPLQSTLRFSLTSLTSFISFFSCFFRTLFALAASNFLHNPFGFFRFPTLSQNTGGGTLLSLQSTGIRLFPVRYLATTRYKPSPLFSMEPCKQVQPSPFRFTLLRKMAGGGGALWKSRQPARDLSVDCGFLHSFSASRNFRYNLLARGPVGQRQLVVR
jgi:hypothetical protein